ncbi:LacI family DNA-binding transcriptional regulator [Ammoniphilus resinae]|uniref:DNA-binding LacI/PurR family transcriptional regulator n=1 Tax=Ammoniphilus resinae TaxID=861532 RepID=A0ABS4GUM9_9BACL|nr:LacI family DNA-binding transcriptional regulator [Ammoniphilus resinae]MBP1933822.1 DNA-binding LacI/PurR family transcriptional regulator [Ammoniphilus resinae]
MRRKPTIQDVANLARVSKSTVSKFLNDVPYVSRETRKKIEQAIQTLDFRPNTFARGLVNHTSGLIGLVISGVDVLVNVELIKAIELEAGKHGYHVVLVSTNDDYSLEKEIPQILSEKFHYLDGVILANAREGMDLELLRETFEHVVMVHRYIPNDVVDFVTIDGYIGGKLAAEYLIGLGHKKLGMIAGPAVIYQSRDRLEGFKDTLKEYGLLEDSVIIESGYSVEEGFQAAEMIMFDYKDVTAIFASSDMIALGVLDAARLFRWKIPEDLSVIGFDNMAFSRLARVPLTTVDGRIKEMGQMAVRKLMERIKRERKEREQAFLRPSLIVRESCREFT